MTIETGASQGSARSTAATESNASRGKANQSDAGGAPGGFMAVLASMDAPDASAGGADAAAGDTSAPNAAQPATSGSIAAALKAASLRGTTGSPRAGKGADAGAALDANAVADGDTSQALLRDSTDITAVGGATDPLAKVQTDVPLDAAMLLAQASQRVAVPEPNTGAGSPGVATTALPGAKVAATVLKPELKPEGAAVLNGSVGEAAVESTGKSSKAHKEAAAKLALASAALAAPTESVAPPDARTLAAIAKIADQPMAPLAAAVTLANTATPLRREEQTRERSVFRPNATEGTAMAQPFQALTSSTPVQAVQDANMPADMYVAEKVAYWISNDVQNAELKLDGIGKDPVEVSIRMQGNEAHVAFRTDELQARAALENASVHLKDLLQREGLVLSGVSVGTANTGDSGERGRNSHQGGRQTVLAPVQSVPADRRAVSGRTVGGGLDLFV